jgi:hypothetical protein
MQAASTVHASFLPRKMSRLKGFDAKDYRDLKRIGIHLSDSELGEMARRYAQDTGKFAMDDLQPTVTTGSMATPVQFLQAWLPGFVYVDTAAIKIDDFVGMSIVGNYEDAEVVQPLMELTGLAVPYGDYSNVPMASWNTNFEQRTAIRFEQGMQVGQLEAKTAARMRVDSASSKRQSAAKALEINRNSVGFNGYNNGANNTYGFLNDPGEPAYVTVPVGASAQTFWSTKTYLEIVNDIQGMAARLQNQSQDLINPEDVNLTLGLATEVYQYLATVSDFGNSVRDWITKTYPRMRVVSAPQLNAASGGLNVGYMYAEVIDDMSTDGGKVFDQWVLSKFMVVGVEQRAKGYIEDYSNSLAGVACKRPWAITRVNGI